jgi:hypothetical protein
MDMKRITTRLTPTQLEFLKNNSGISKGIRETIDKAIILASKKNKYHIEAYRSNTSGYAYFDLQAKDLEDAMEQSKHLMYVLKENEVLKDNFWYLKEVKQVA